MKNTERTGDRPNNDLLNELFRHAAPRAKPPQAAELAARAALHEQWLELTLRRKRHRLYWPLAAAASLILATGVAVVLLRNSATISPPRPMATIEVVVGTVRQQATNQPGQVPLAAEMQLKTGQRISTGQASGLAVRWLDGSSVRLDENTDAELTARGEIRLDTGRVYVDAEESIPALNAVVIQTPAGRVQHVGTQYMTDVSATGTTVSVRRGRIRIDGPEASAGAGAGEQLRVDGASGFATRQTIPTYGELWQWTQATAPEFDADGRSVAEFLEWVSRESGRAISYASPEARLLAQQTQLRGRIDLEPMTALALILQTSDLGYELRNGSLLIRPTGAH